MEYKKVFKIISIMLIIIIFFPYSITLAATAKEAGNAIATFAKNYYEKVQSRDSDIVYIYHPYNREDKGEAHFNEYRAIPRGGEPILSPYSDTVSFKHYALDCVGWVNYCVYKSTGIEFESIHNGTGGYVVPGVGGQTSYGNGKYFKNLPSGSTAQPGDILYSDKHVMIYIGNGQAIHSTQGYDTMGPFLTTNISAYNLARITDEIVEDINPKTLVTDPDIANGIGGSNLKKESEFYYNGIPNGEYSVTAGIEEFIVDILKDVLDYIIGIITLFQRMTFVGWTTIIENLISDTIKNIDDVSDNDSTQGQDPTSYEVDEDTITLETIIFNDLNILNVNFFEQATKNASE